MDSIFNARDRKKRTWDVGIEKEKEPEEGEKLASFFGVIYEFFNPVPDIPLVPVLVPVIPVVPVSHFNSFVPASLPVTVPNYTKFFGSVTASVVVLADVVPHHCISTSSST